MVNKAQPKDFEKMQKQVKKLTMRLWAGILLLVVMLSAGMLIAVNLYYEQIAQAVATGDYNKGTGVGQSNELTVSDWNLLLTDFGGSWAVSGSDVYRSTGNVGIGIASASEKLDVGGKIRATDMIIAGANIMTQSAGLANIYLGADAANNDIQIGSTNPSITDIAFWNTGGTGAAMDISANNILANGTVCDGGGRCLNNLGGGMVTTQYVVSFNGQGNWAGGQVSNKFLNLNQADFCTLAGAYFDPDGSTNSSLDAHQYYIKKEVDGWYAYWRGHVSGAGVVSGANLYVNCFKF